MSSHTMKVLPLRFALIAEHRLRFVLMRRSMYADRIETDDRLSLCEEGIYNRGPTGRTIQCRITHVISALEMPELPEGIVAVSLKVLAVFDTHDEPIWQRGEQEGGACS